MATTLADDVSTPKQWPSNPLNAIHVWSVCVNFGIMQSSFVYTEWFTNKKKIEKKGISLVVLSRINGFIGFS